MSVRDWDPLHAALRRQAVLQMTRLPQLASLQSDRFTKYSLTFVLDSSCLTAGLQCGSHTEAELFRNAQSNFYEWEACL